MGVEGSGGGSHYPDDGTDLSFLSSLPPLGDLRTRRGREEAGGSRVFSI